MSVMGELLTKCLQLDISQATKNHSLFDENN